jgi:AraC family transcriptional regulator of adaptative response/methylated-DNA-[protein]-cysteine methyltransferase
MLRYTLTACALGRLLLAGTDHGVRALYFGDADGPLVAELGREFPDVSAIRDDEGLRRWAERVAAQLKFDRPVDDLPLDVIGTTFQRRVWDELRRIPAGGTRTYAEVAIALGQPATAARAVGRACATNAVSLLIPCHRVLRGDGGLGGYRWGLHRKQRLLDDERRQAARLV